MDAQDQQTKPTAKLFTKDFIMIALVNFAAFTAFQMTNNGLPVVLAKLQANDFEVGLTLTLVTLTALIVRPFAGLVLDLFGRKGTLYAGLIVTAAATAMYAVFPIVTIILLVRIVHGIGWGFSTTGCSTMVSDILPKPRFAEGMGWYALGVSLSVAIGPALSIFLVEAISSEAMIMVSSALVGLAFVLSLGVDEKVKVEKGSFSLSSLTIENFIEKRAIMPALGIALVNLGFSAITAFIAIYGLSIGVSDIALYFVVYAVVNLVSRPPIGRIIDKTGFFVPGILGFIGVAIAMAIIASATDVIMFCIAGVFAGLGLGTVMSTLQTMAVASCPPARRGVANSTFLIGLDGGLCVGSVIAGIASSLLGYSGMFLVMALFPLMALVIFALGFKAWERLAASSSPAAPAAPPNPDQP